MQKLLERREKLLGSLSEALAAETKNKFHSARFDPGHERGGVFVENARASLFLRDAGKARMKANEIALELEAIERARETMAGAGKKWAVGRMRARSKALGAARESVARMVRGNPGQAAIILARWSARAPARVFSTSSRG